MELAAAATSSLRRRRRAASFAGGGFMAIYHAGVGLAIQDHAPGLFSEQLDNMYGASVGSVVAVFHACGIPPTEFYKLLKEMYDSVRSICWWAGRFVTLHPRFDIVQLGQSILEKTLPPDAHRRCRGRVGVSLTVLPTLENWIVSDFNTRAELIQAISCSSFVPLYSGMWLPKFRGKYCCDGGFSSNLPFSDDPSVITISPFSGECDICPASDDESYYQLFVSNQIMDISVSNLCRGFSALFMLPWTEMEKICQQGYSDAVNFLRKEGIIQHRVLFPLTKPKPLTSETSATSDYYSELTPVDSRCSSALSVFDQDSDNEYY